MLVSVEKRLAIFAMPKCASTALHAELRGVGGIRLSGSPTLKHMNYRTYRRFLVPYLDHLGVGPVETVCLFREPLDWLGSYWRYRRRDAVAGRRNSTRDVCFPEFVRRYIDGRRAPANLHAPADFVADEEGRVGIDRIWRYENAEAFFDYVRGRLDRPPRPLRANVSPGRRVSPDEIPPDLLSRFRHHAQRDYEIYERVAI